jgi:hypothetical protein
MSPVPRSPSYFTINLTDGDGKRSHIHCLVVYEAISPSTVENSDCKVRHIQIECNSLTMLDELVRRSSFESVETNYTERITINNLACEEQRVYVPVALCMHTMGLNCDFYRSLLEGIYNYTWDVYNEEFGRLPQTDARQVASFEFLRQVLPMMSLLQPLSTHTHLQIDMGRSKFEMPIYINPEVTPNETFMKAAFDFMEIPHLIKLWQSLLLERQIILISSRKTLLFAISESLQALIYPIQWLHTSVSCLPKALLELIEAPTPYVICVSSEIITAPEIETLVKDAIIYNIDTGALIDQQLPEFCSKSYNRLRNRLMNIKAYRFANSERASVFDPLTDASQAEDVEFMEKILKLKSLRTEAEVINYQITLIRQAFFMELYEVLRVTPMCISESIQIEMARFNRLFKHCNEPGCKGDKFWKEFLGTAIYNQILDKFITENPEADALMMLEFYMKELERYGQAQKHPSNFVLNKELTGQILYQAFQSRLENIQDFEYMSLDEAGRYTLSVGLEYIKEIQHILCESSTLNNDHLYQTTPPSVFSTITMSTNNSENNSTFYGQAGLIRTLTILMESITPISNQKLAGWEHFEQELEREIMKLSRIHDDECKLTWKLGNTNPTVIAIDKPLIKKRLPSESFHRPSSFLETESPSPSYQQKIRNRTLTLPSERFRYTPLIHSFSEVVEPDRYALNKRCRKCNKTVEQSPKKRRTDRICMACRVDLTADLEGVSDLVFEFLDPVDQFNLTAALNADFGNRISLGLLSPRRYF